MISFTGYEEDIYYLESPEQLSAPYGRLLSEVLHPGEKVLHLMLCPIWNSTTKPFAIDAPRTSHLFCLTDARFLALRDYHLPHKEPETLSIDRAALVGLEFGQALLMSWLALYVRAGQVIAKEGFYFPQHGNKFVAAMLRTWRESWPVCETLRKELKPLSQRDVFRVAGYFHERLLRPLLLPDETCLRVDQRPPIWGNRNRWLRLWPVGLAHWGTVVLTDRAFFYVCGQPPLGRKGYVFAHNLWCFSLRTPCRAEFIVERRAGTECACLKLNLGNDNGRELNILFPHEQAALVARWAEEMNQIGASAMASASPQGNAEFR